MRRLIVSEFVTLDGVMEAPGGEPTHPHTGWVAPFVGPEFMDYKLAEILDAESHLLGRVTWESFHGAWPERTGEFADKVNAMPKHVVSSTLRDPGWNTTVIASDVEASVQALKDGDGGPILVAGSATLVHTLLLAGLVDELRLMVFPVAIGNGLRLFPDERTKVDFELTGHHVWPSGVTVSEWRPTIAR